MFFFLLLFVFFSCEQNRYYKSYEWISGAEFDYPEWENTKSIDFEIPITEMQFEISVPFIDEYYRAHKSDFNASEDHVVLYENYLTDKIKEIKDKLKGNKIVKEVNEKESKLVIEI